jgi:beta-phosphoglucomutase-like phosphatase (HAD superfamily)
MLRRQIDHEAFDAAVFSLDAVAVDLGYGDVRPLPGAIAWIDRLREDDKRIGVTAGVDRAVEALHLAGISDRVDVVVTGADPAARLRRALEELGAVPDRTVVAAAGDADLAAACAAGVELVVGVARCDAGPERLRRAGAVTVVADLSELLGPSG